MKKLSVLLAMALMLTGIGLISYAEEEPVTIEFMTSEYVNAPLMMAFFCQFDICCTTNFVRYIPYSLSVSYKIEISHNL